ncbi:MAG TPA: GAF domain-containing protein [Candidatus Dormibacteraeota bacterium]|nr:GAF domain-containing protein [Candidatus Dormibacteraeota bacterium]
MGEKRAPESARVEEQIVVAWKQYAERKAQGLQRITEGACYLDPRPCPFEPRPDFEGRFVQDCVHCARMQGQVEEVQPNQENAPGVIPTLALLFHLLQEEAKSVRREHEDGLEDEAERYRSAGFLFRSIPLMHVALTHERIARLLLTAIGGAFAVEVDTLLLFKIAAEGQALELMDSFRRADREDPDEPMRTPLDLDAFEAGGGFDSDLFEALRDEGLSLDPDRDLLADAVFDGRACMVPSAQREIRLPEQLAEALPEGPVAILPLFGREKVLGVLVAAQTNGFTGWTADQMELLSAIATQAAIAFEGNTVLDVVRRRGAAVRSAIDFSRTAALPTRPDLRAEQALKALLAATQAAGGLAWVRGDDDSLDLAHVHAVDPGSTQDLGTLGGWFLQWFEADGKAMTADNVAEDPRFSGFLPEDWRCLLAAPIVSQSRVAGALLVFNKSGGTQDDPLSFDAEDARVAELIASIASLADTRSSQEETLRVKDRRLHEIEAQLRHAEKLAVVGERGVQVAQDVRNPVAAITGFAKRVLKSLPAKDPNREYLEIILRETERLERVLSEQVALAQMTRPRLKLENLNALVQDVLQSQAEDLVRRRVRLLKRLSPDVPTLLLDNEKMRQVLVNVLSYALHSVPSGGRVRVETRAAQGAVQAEIAHDGPKVAGEVLDRLFVPFSTSRRYGAGVGLAMAYQIVREHGGEIRARSEGDWSSIVTIYLPTRENDDRRRRPDRRDTRSDRRRKLA